MKKVLVCFLILSIASIMIISGVCADDGSWYCPKCGRLNSADDNFCPKDRTANPFVSSDVAQDSDSSLQNGRFLTYELIGVGTRLKNFDDESKRHQSYFGPGTSYEGAGAYKPYKVTLATALFREDDFVLVDMSYQTVGRRCVYFKASALTNADAEQKTFTGQEAVTITSVQPLFGPGFEYDKVDMTVKNKKTGKNSVEDIILGAGTKLNVFFETNGWVFAEFECELGVIRAWIPLESVK